MSPDPTRQQVSQFIEAPAFSRYREDYLDDDSFRELQATLAANPEAGDIIPDVGGIRKLRWKDPRRGKGKRGGLRIIYYCFLSDGEIWLLTLYDKSEASDLSKNERGQLRRALEAERAARKRRGKMSREKTNKRNLFAELMEGVEAMQAHREGKLTLRTHTVPAPQIKGQANARFFIAARNRFNVSRPVWAKMLHVSPRTVEKWEQGGQISTLAATLVELVSRYPDTIKRLQSLPVRAARGQRAGRLRHSPKRPKGVGGLVAAKQAKRTASR